MKAKFLTILLSAVFLFGCGSDDETTYTCDTCVDAPEASAANDLSGKGIYKGLVIGSSGTIKFNINNNGSYSAVLELDGETYELTTEATFDPQIGFEALFTGTMNTTDDIKIGFWVNSNGSSYGVWVESIPGHPNATIEVAKEFSNELVVVYEGTFSGDASGVFNMIVRNDEWLVLAREETDQGYSEFEGTLTNGSINCVDCCVECTVVITGKVNGDEASGGWTDPDGGKGSWRGKRTL